MDKRSVRRAQAARGREGRRHVTLSDRNVGGCLRSTIPSARGEHQGSDRRRGRSWVTCHAVVRIRDRPAVACVPAGRRSGRRCARCRGGLAAWVRGLSSDVGDGYRWSAGPGNGAGGTGVAGCAGGTGGFGQGGGARLLHRSFRPVPSYHRNLPRHPRRLRLPRCHHPRLLLALGHRSSPRQRPNAPTRSRKWTMCLGLPGENQRHRRSRHTSR
jgi:hypothetical protein